jgi:hypothetical protein
MTEDSNVGLHKLSPPSNVAQASLFVAINSAGTVI